MTEKKRFRLGPAIVNISAMSAPLAESVINIAAAALRYDLRIIVSGVASKESARLSSHPPRCLLRDEMTEELVAGAVKRRLVEKYPADIWQV